MRGLAAAGKKPPQHVPLAVHNPFMISLDASELQPVDLPDDHLQVLAQDWRRRALHGEAFARGPAHECEVELRRSPSRFRLSPPWVRCPTVGAAGGMWPGGADARILFEWLRSCSILRS